jgi:ZIP family zinc transporter
MASAATVSQSAVAGVMALGVAVWISPLAFDLVDEAKSTGELGPTLVVAILGAAIVCVIANVALVRFGAGYRKRSQNRERSEQQAPSGFAVGIGLALSVERL